MAIDKPRTFQYRPPERRARQLREPGERRRIEIPRAGDGRARGGGVSIRLFIMLAAVLGIAAMMFAIR